MTDQDKVEVVEGAESGEEISNDTSEVATPESEQESNCAHPEDEETTEVSLVEEEAQNQESIKEEQSDTSEPPEETSDIEELVEDREDYKALALEGEDSQRPLFEVDLIEDHFPQLSLRFCAQQSIISFNSSVLSVKGKIECAHERHTGSSSGREHKIMAKKIKAIDGPCTVVLAQGIPGRIIEIIEGQGLFIQNRSLVAATDNLSIEVDPIDGPGKFFSSDLLFFAKCFSTGFYWLQAYGEVFEVTDFSEPIVIETSRVLAYTEGLQVDVIDIKGYKSFHPRMESLVASFQGEGTVWYQTHSYLGLATLYAEQAVLPPR